MALGEWADALELLPPGLHPSLRTEGAVIVARERVTREDVVVEQAAVVHHARDQPDVVLRGRCHGQLPGPGLERVQDQHGPVDQLAVALEAADHVQNEAVRGARGHAQPAGQPLLPQLAERLPDLGRLEPAPVGVVEEEQVEWAGADPFEAPLGGEAHVVAIAVGAAQARVGEAGEALRPLALARVEVVADRAHQLVVRPGDALEGAAQQAVRLSLAVDVGRHHDPDAVAGAKECLEALLRDGLPEAHEAPAAPGAYRHMTVHALTLWWYQ